jgi:hypothetical protein
MPSTAPRTTPSSGRIRPSRFPRNIPSRSRSSRSRSTTTNSRRSADDEARMPTRTQQLGLIIVLAALVVYVFIRVL